MFLTTLVLFSVLATASGPDLRKRQCIEPPPVSPAPGLPTSPSVPVPSATPSTAPGNPTEPFLLRIQASGPQPLPRRKRQTTTGTYLEDASSVSPFCEQGGQFRIIQGRLFFRDQFVSVSDPPASKPLLQGGATGAISIGFSFTGGVLSWNNPGFPRLSASFCLLGETVFVYFENRLEGCVDVSLFFASLSECPGPQGSSSTAASTAPSTSGSQLSLPSSASSGTTPGDASTPQASSTAAETTPGSSAQDSSTTASVSLAEPTTSSIVLSTPRYMNTSSTMISQSQSESMMSEPSSTEPAPTSQDSVSSTSASATSPESVTSEGSLTSITSTASEQSYSVTSTSEPSTSETSTSDTSSSETSTSESTSLTSASSEEPTSSTESTSSSSTEETSSTSSSSTTEETTTTSSSTAEETTTTSSTTEETTTTTTSSSTAEETTTTTSSSSSSSESSTSSSSSSSSSTSTSAEPTGTPNTAGTFPQMIGAGTLLDLEPKTEDNIGFGFKEDAAGSLGYTQLSPGDDLGFYSTGSVTGVDYCNLVGYLYHKRTGLCVTAVGPNSPTPPRYTGTSMALQACDVSGAEPPESQKFCGIDYTANPTADYQCGIFLLFQGETTAGVPYGVSYGSSDLPATFTFPGGFYWIYARGCV